MNRVSPFVILLTASGLLHAAGAGGALIYLAGNEEATAEKVSLRIALGSRGASAGQSVEAEHHKEMEWPAEPELQPKPVPSSKVKTRPERQPFVKPVVDAEPSISEIAEQAPAPEPVLRKLQATPGNAGKFGTSENPEPDTGGETSDAGYKAALISYDGIVLGHLAHFKTFPPAARMRGEEGNVAVEFEIDRMGNLLTCRLLAPSGSRWLDKAALRQIRDAAPFPAPPAKTKWAARTYSTTMRYTLN